MGKTNRIKAKAIATPKTREAAEQLLGQIGSLQRAVAVINAKMNDELAAIKEAFEAEASPLNAEIEQQFQAVQAWAESHRDELLKGRAKTAKLSTGEISWRTTPPAVSVRGKPAVIAACKQLGLVQFIRTVEDVDKSAMLATEESRASAQAINGVTISQKEEFIAKPFESEIERVATVKRDTKQAAAA